MGRQDMSIVQPKEPKSGKPLQRAQLSALYGLLNEYLLRATLCQPYTRHWEHSSEHNEISVLVGLMFQAHIPYIGGDRSAKQMQI